MDPRPKPWFKGDSLPCRRSPPDRHLTMKNSPLSMITVCSLTFRDDHIGLGVLINSLVASGFAGRIVVGFSGEQPPWCAQFVEIAPVAGRREFSVKGTEVTLSFRYYDPRVFYGNVKPHLMRQVLDEGGGSLKGVIYFDPDIVVRCKWGVFERWLDFGVALVEDVNPYMPVDHPKRGEWVKCGLELGFQLERPTSQYFNSGFLGVPAAGRQVLERWIGFLGKVVQLGYSDEQGSIGEPDHPFHRHDQDCLNAAVMFCGAKTATVGGDGMSFLPGGYLMAHAVCPEAKPWRRRYLTEALGGRPPNPVDLAFWQHTAAPIHVLPKSRMEFARAAMRIASAAGRFYRRR
jgi:hypothetical protein